MEADARVATAKIEADARTATAEMEADARTAIAKMTDNTRMAITKMDIECRNRELELRNRELEFRKRNSNLGIIKDVNLGRLSAATNLTTMEKAAPLPKPPSCLEDVDNM